MIYDHSTTTAAPAAGTDAPSSGKSALYAALQTHTRPFETTLTTAATTKRQERSCQINNLRT
jgi:hypothetical protein